MDSKNTEHENTMAENADENTVMNKGKSSAVSQWLLLGYGIIALVIFFLAVGLVVSVGNKHKAGTDTANYVASIGVSDTSGTVKSQENIEAMSDAKTDTLLYGKTIVVDAGHGGNDEGTLTLDETVLEKDINLSVVEKLKTIYLDNVAGANIRYTRLEDKNVPLKSRVRLANKLHADLFVSIHVNASDYREEGPNGLESLFSNKKLDAPLSNKKIAKLMLTELANSTGNKSRGIIARDDLYILNNSDVPAAILEIGYISNPYDLQMMTTEDGQEAIASGIFQGIKRVFAESQDVAY